MTDKLEVMWEQQRQFMKLLVEKRGFPKFPVNITEKPSQKLLKDISHHLLEELFEANQHLKNAKSHRLTELPEVDLEAFKVELVDVLHLFIEYCIVAGISVDDLYETYMSKGELNTKRILGDY
jgi:NTP pyrophosphatase (non-canonical NTP hydrolase)